MKTILNVKVEKEIKKKAQRVAKDLGISLSFAVNAHLRKFIQTREIYIGEPLTPNKKTAARLKKIMADINAGRNLSPGFNTMNEAIEYLHK